MATPGSPNAQLRPPRHQRQRAAAVSGGARRAGANRVEAITFDYWNTLMHEDGSSIALRRELWAARLGSVGVAVADHELDVAFEGGWRRFTEAWEANRQYRIDDAARDLLVDLGLEHLDGDLHGQLVADLDVVAERVDLMPAPGIERCLRRLRGAGLRIGIICDVGMTPSTSLRRQLERHDLLGYFDHWSFSDDVGWYKPAPEIFRHALEGLGVTDPSTVAHIGDLRRTDVAGARAMGMTSVRYRGLADDTSEAPEADIVCDHHDDLPELLGLA
jgi:FMN phosphatase YigB (HAD superfamily)